MKIDLYELLGVSREATQEEIKKALQHNIEILEDRKNITEQAAELLGEYVFEVDESRTSDTIDAMRYAIEGMKNFRVDPGYFDGRTF